MRRFEAAVLAVALVGAPWYSKPASAEPSKEDITTAKAAIREARELRDKGKHAEALPKFKAAYGLVPTPLTALELARGHLALGQLIEARELLATIGNMPKPSAEKAEHEDARKEASGLLPAVTARIPEITLTIKGDPTGFVVSIDGQALKAETLTVARKVNPGKHSVIAREGDETVFSLDVTLAEAEQRTVEVTLPVHQKVIEAPPPKDKPTPPSRAQRTVGLVLGGVGVVGIGIGTWLFVDGKGTYDQNIAKCDTTCPRLEGEAAAAGTSRARAGLAIGGAGLLIAGAGVILYVLAPSPRAPVITLGPSGFTVRGSF